MSTFDESFRKALAATASKPSIRCPSAPKLVSTFNISSADANKIRKLCKLADEPKALAALIEAEHPKTAAYVRRLHSSPYHSKMWRRTVVLLAINHVLDAHGVEALGPDVGGPSPPPYEYINMGDAYATTLIYKRATDNLFIGSWGNIAERHPSW